jgi:probable rRNA maturation factor
MAVRTEGIGLSKLSKRAVVAWVNKATKALKRKDDDVAVIFVNASKIRRLNREYRGLDKPTDVLSFPVDAKGELGDIFIAPPIAKKKAVARGESYKSYLELLVVHSVLHLGGYDHHGKNDSAKMEKMEKKIMKYKV